MNKKSFQTKILNWYEKYGRKDLPWQKNPTPYRVWISEIMLQQTQVSTVISYYQRFLERFPKIQDLATANIDDVVHLWSGLGYYARARNLHQCAKIIHENYKNRFPGNLETLIALPGIGRSTAGAILSLSKNKNTPILDGNVKRVFIRFHAIEGESNNTAVQKKLWKLAEDLIPLINARKYNQALMDIGALICTRTKPDCKNCPLRKSCQAYALNLTQDLPIKKQTKPIPTKKTFLLLLKNPKGEYLLEKRPPIGIWGSLWSFPMGDTQAQLIKLSKKEYCCKVISTHKLPAFRHTFSHFHLDITPILANVKPLTQRIMDTQQFSWYDPRHSLTLGLPQPIKRLLEQLNS